MSNIKKNGWTGEEDQLLATTVLKYISEGKTQVAACDFVASEINKTSAAARFRWNSKLRKEYEKEVEVAKKTKESLKKESNTLGGNTKAKDIVVSAASTLCATSGASSAINDVLLQIEEGVNTLKHQLLYTTPSIEEFDLLQSENASLKAQLNQSIERVNELESLYSQANSIVEQIQRITIGNK